LCCRRHAAGGAPAARGAKAQPARAFFGGRPAWGVPGCYQGLVAYFICILYFILIPPLVIYHVFGRLVTRGVQKHDFFQTNPSGLIKNNVAFLLRFLFLLPRLFARFKKIAFLDVSEQGE
jgi:hypothetical protein